MRLRQIVRQLLRTPGFTATAVLTLALGIGATTAMFAVVYGVLVQPLPYPDAERLVSIRHRAPGLNIATDLGASPTMYFTYRDDNRAFSAFGLYSTTAASVTGLGDPERVSAIAVTYGALDAVGVAPAIGRIFSEADDTPGSPETVMLSHGYWQRRLGGDPQIVGRSLTIDGRPRAIIGVMPQSFRFMDQAVDVYLPHRFDRHSLTLGDFSYQAVARLKRGVTVAQANADVARMIPAWIDGWPTSPGVDRQMFTSARIAPALRPLKDFIVGDVGGVLWVIMGTIGVVLLIACANVANLLLVRAEGRQHELAIRAALGAGSRRIVRELMLESSVLGMIAGAVGVALAVAAVRLVVAVAPSNVPRLTEIAIDAHTLLFALAIAIASGVLLGATGASRYAVSGGRLATVLRSGGRTGSASRSRVRVRHALVVVQVALALVLLVAAGLMIRSAAALRSVRPGFTAPDQVQLVRIAIPESQVPGADDVLRMQQAICDRLAAVPGVSAVSFANGAPLDGGDSWDILFANDREFARGTLPPIRSFRFVAPDAFKALGVQVVAGRDFTWADLLDHRPVAIVSENLAREWWTDPSEAIGKRVAEVTTSTWREVVGVVTDVRSTGLEKDPPTTVYWPALMQNFWGNQERVQRAATFIIRSPRTGTPGFLDELRRAVWAVNGTLPLAQVRSLQLLYERSLSRTSFALLMLTIAAGMALLLGVIGIYGVLAYAVSQRTREIGIRLALGAQQREVKRMFVANGLSLAGVGLAAGVGGALLLTRVMRALLFGVTAVDPLTYAAVAAALLAAAALASYLPARRAASVDPVNSLRSE